MKNKDRIEIKLSKLEEGQIIKYLAKDITLREMAKNIGYSPQGAVNFALSVCRQWFRKGSLKYNPMI